jgi:hypothetical protein
MRKAFNYLWGSSIKPFYANLRHDDFCRLTGQTRNGVQVIQPFPQKGDSSPPSVHQSGLYFSIPGSEKFAVLPYSSTMEVIPHGVWLYHFLGH